MSLRVASFLNTAQRDSLLRRLLAGELPDRRGRFGPFGGCYAPEILMPALLRLAGRVGECLHSAAFRAEYHAELRRWAGRPTPLTQARGLSQRWRADVWLKREDRAHTGAHTVNNALGQALLARHCGASRVITATGSGHHGLSTAAACRYLGLRCTVYLGADVPGRQPRIVERIRAYGAEVASVDSGDRALCAALDEAFRDWVADPDGSHFLPGSAIGPHPYPWLVRELQSVIGQEARAQMLEAAGGLPAAAFASIGGGGNAIGLFHPLLADECVRLIGVETGGAGRRPGAHAASLCRGAPGVMHGSRSLWVQDADGQLLRICSVAAGMNYPGVGPEHALLQAIGRVRYTTVTDDEAREAQRECMAAEDFACAIEAAHGLAGARRWAADHPGARILVTVSGSAWPE